MIHPVPACDIQPSPNSRRERDRMGSSTPPATTTASAASPFIAERVAVTVPATCANLGPGFDCLALSLDLANRFEVEIEPMRLKGQAYRVEVRGAVKDIGHLARKRENLFLYAFRRLCERQGVAMPLVRLRIAVNLPPSRGLGSSATAVVGGLLAANALLGDPLTRDEVLEMAVSCEPGHHADNVAAALYGGLVVTGVRDAEGRLVTVAYPMPPELRAVLYIPDMPMSTVHGRALLPAAYTRADVTFNLSRVALLLAALQTGRFDLLGTAMEDRIHQPYREQLFPALRPILTAARVAGAHGACLSGGGSSLLALTSAHAEEVRDAMASAARYAGVGGSGLVAAISREGAHAELDGMSEGDTDA